MGSTQAAQAPPKQVCLDVRQMWQGRRRFTYTRKTPPEMIGRFFRWLLAPSPGSAPPRPTRNPGTGGGSRCRCCENKVWFARRYETYRAEMLGALTALREAEAGGDPRAIRAAERRVKDIRNRFAHGF